MTLSTAQAILNRQRAGTTDPYRWREIPFLIRAKYTKACHAEGVEVEDFVQEVAETILRQRTSNPWDPTRRRWAGYVLLVAGSVWSHLREKLRRRLPQAEGKDVNPVADAQDPPQVLFAQEDPTCSPQPRRRGPNGQPATSAARASVQPGS